MKLRILKPAGLLDSQPEAPGLRGEAFLEALCHGPSFERNRLRPRSRILYRTDDGRITTRADVRMRAADTRDAASLSWCR
jgi:hypothetical protein